MRKWSAGDEIEEMRTSRRLDLGTSQELLQYCLTQDKSWSSFWNDIWHLEYITRQWRSDYIIKMDSNTKTKAELLVIEVIVVCMTLSGLQCRVSNMQFANLTTTAIKTLVNLQALWSPTGDQVLNESLDTLDTYRWSSRMFPVLHCCTGRAGVGPIFSPGFSGLYGPNSFREEKWALSFEQRITLTIPFYCILDQHLANKKIDLKDQFLWKNVL